MQDTNGILYSGWGLGGGRGAWGLSARENVKDITISAGESERSEGNSCEKEKKGLAGKKGMILI